MDPTPERLPERLPSDLDSLTPTAISFEEIHRRTRIAAALENGGRLRMAFDLLFMEEAGFQRPGGSSSVPQYAESHYKRPHNEALAMIRVAKALRDLPKLREAYAAGFLGWECVELLTQVATAETEAEWLEFCEKKRMSAIRAEVLDAIEKKRKKPRNPGRSLPNSTVVLRFKLKLNEYEVVLKAMNKVSGELAQSLGGVKPRPEQSLIFMSRRMLETDPVGAAPERKEGDESLFTLLYVVCPECRKDGRPAVMMTGEGPVEIPNELVDAVERKAKKVFIRPEDEERPVEDGAEGSNGAPPAAPPSIDRPTPAWMRRKLFLRDGGVCQNPCCGRRTALQGAHIRARSKGGPTVLGNETLLCVWCHALEDEGILKIRGKPPDLIFETPGQRLDREMETELRAMARVAIVNVPATASPSDAASGGDRIEPGSDRDLDDLSRGLLRMGWGRIEAREALGRAREDLVLEGQPLTPENLLTAAIRGRRRTNGGPPPSPG